MNAHAATWSRVLAAILGGAVVAIAACVCLGFALPDRGRGVALGALFGVPVWVGLMTIGLLAKSAGRLWLSYFAAAVVLTGVSWLLR